MTREEAKKFLNDTKVYVNGKSEEIQKILFSLGFKWCDGSQKVKKVNCPFLFLHNGWVSCNNDMIFFTRCAYQEITAEDILNIIIDKPEPTYRPFKDVEECWNEMHKHKPFGWLINNPEYYLTFSTHAAYILTSDNYDFEEAFNTFTFADGTPFGIEED